MLIGLALVLSLGIAVQDSDPIEWQDSYAEARIQSAETGKPILVYLYDSI